MAERRSRGAISKKNSNPPKYTHLSLAEKCVILQRLDAGETNTQLAREYGVAHSAISYIKKTKESIYAHRALVREQQGSDKKTRLTATDTSPLEQGIYKWFCQKRSLGEPISGPMLRKKALLYNEKLGGPSTFQASNGWIQRFKTRHRIRELCMKGEKLFGNVGASSEFVTNMNRIVKEGDYSLDNIYNADETGLAWKSLPRKTFVARNETEVAGRKALEDRVTVMACANASGTHRIPLLVIGKYQKPKCLKNVKNLPVNYRGQSSAWIDREIFSDWYKNIFLPAIKTRNNGDDEKFLLLLDNAPSHPSAEELNSIDDSCRVIFLPPNVTALIQPMDQGVIEATKKYYKKTLVRQLLVAEYTGEEEQVTKFLKQWNMLNCCEAISQAWNTLSNTTLRNAWKNIMFPGTAGAAVADVGDCELTRLIRRIPGYNDFTNDETIAWLEEDSEQPVWRILDDDNLLNMSQPEDTSMDSDPNDSQEDDDDCDAQKPEDPLPPREILKSLNTVHQWYRTRWESEMDDFPPLYKIRQILEDIILEQ